MPHTFAYFANVWATRASVRLWIPLGPNVQHSEPRRFDCGLDAFHLWREPTHRKVRDVWGTLGLPGPPVREIDALVVHIPPRDAWYVLPVEDFAGSKCLRFYPDIECKAARWERYREAWGLLRGEGTAGALARIGRKLRAVDQ